MLLPQAKAAAVPAVLCTDVLHETDIIRKLYYVTIVRPHLEYASMGHLAIYLLMDQQIVKYLKVPISLLAECASSAGA